MWAVEKDPALRSDLCNLSVLDHAPDPDRLREKIAMAVQLIPSLGRRVVSAPLRIAPPEWVADPTLDLDYHLRSVSVSGEGDERALLDLCASLAEAPFDRGRPLWELTLIEGLADGRVAFLQKLHHTITDGVGGLKLSLALVDFEPDPAPPDAAAAAESTPPSDKSHTPLHVTRDALIDAAGRQVEMVRSTLGSMARLATHPLDVPGAIGEAARMAGSVRRQALVTESAHSDVMRNRSLRRRFDRIEVPLADVRAAADALDGTVNDVFVTAVAGALGHYHASRGSDTRDLRMAMPVNKRERGDVGANRFAPARVVVPIQPIDPRARFAATAAALRSVRTEPALDAVDRLAGLVSGLPTSILVSFTRIQTRTIDFATSNLRGSPVPLYLAGAPILGNFGFGPRTGCAVNVTMMSYCGSCQLAFNIDPAAIDDPDAFMGFVRQSFDEIAAAARQ